jgi:DNA polymerase/3'-5' exonuclease PolX
MKKTNNIRGDSNGDDKNKLFELIGLISINGITFEKAAELHVLLGINNVQDLYEACKRGEVSRLKGWGEITQEKIKSEIELHVLWMMSKCAKVKKENSSDYKTAKIDKEFLLILARIQANKNNK